MTHAAAIDRTKALIFGLLLMLSLILSALPARAAYSNPVFDVLDATNITWEKSVKVRLPVGGANATFSITWE